MNTNILFKQDFAIKTILLKWLVLPLSLILLTGKLANAQKLLDPGTISVVVASSGSANSSVAVAYSVRQLKTTYDHPATITLPTLVSGFTNSATPLLRVRRNTDNAQLDIGYDVNGNLDSVLLKNFVSNNGVNPTASGFVTVWYDQSGNSRDAYQTNTAQQPNIVTAGVVERNPGRQLGIAGKSGGMLEHQFAAGVPMNEFTAPSGINIYGIDSNRTLNVVSQPRVYTNGTAGAGDGSYLIDRNGSTGNQDRPLTCLKAVGSRWSLQIRNLAGDISSSFSGSIDISTSRSDNVTVTRSGNVYAMFVNGVLAGSNTLVGENRMTPVRVGYGTNTGEDVYYGEFILFPSALLSDDLTILNTSQTNYYVLGLPPNTWTGATSSAWATGTNWSSAAAPDALASAIIPSGTPNSPVISNNQTIRSITVNSGATLTVATGGTLNISDSLTVNGTLAGAGTGTVVMNGGLQQLISGTTSPIVFNNLTISNAISRVITNNNIDVTGTLTVNTGATFSPIATAIVNNAVAAGTITGTGTILVTRIAATPDYQSQYKFSTNTLTNLTVNYAGAGDQTINLGVNYGNLAVSGSGTKTLSANISATNVTGNLTVSAATLDNGGFAMVGAGTRVFTVSNGATFTLSGTTSTYPTGFSTYTYGVTSTVNYAGSGAQTIAAANYGNLTSSNIGARTFVGAGTIGIARVFTPGSNTYTITGSTLNFNGTVAQTIPAINYNNLTISGARTASPIITLSSGTINVATTFSITATGVGSYAVSGNTFNYSGAAQTVAPTFAYNNLTLSGSGTKTTTTVTVNGILSLEGTAIVSASPTFGAGATLQFNKTAPYTVDNANWPATFSGTGGVIITGTGAITLNAAKTINNGLSILNTGQLLNLGTFTSTANSLSLGGAGQTAATYGGTTSACGGVTINATYFANATGCITTTSSIATWNGSSSTDWNTPANWTPSGIPTAGVSVIIPSAPVNQPDINTTAASCLNLTINSGATLTSSIDLSISGNFVNNGTATFGSSPIIIAGTIAQNIAPFTTTGDITVSKTAGTATFTGATNAASLTFTASGSTLSFSNTLTLTGALTLNSDAANNVTATITGAGSISCASVAVGTTIAPTANRTTLLTSTLAQLVVSSNLTLTGSFGTNRSNPTFTHTSGIVTVGGSITTVNANAGNTSAYIMGASSPVLNLSGATPFNLSATGTSTTTLNGTGAIVNYNGIVAQVARGTTYLTMKVNNAAGVTLGAATTITTLTIGDITASSIFNDGGFVISTATTLNLTSGTYNLGSASVGTTWPWTTPTLAVGTTVGYISDVAQTVSRTPSYRNLTFTGAGVKTITTGGTLTVTGNWSTTGGTATFAGAANATITGNISGTGAITIGSGTIAVAGAWNNSGTFTKGTGTVNYNGTGGQTIAVLNYNNLTISTARIASPPIVLPAGTITVSGIFSVTATGISGYTNTGNTVEYNGTGAQTVAAINYNNLTISTARTGSPNITFPAGTIGIAGTLTTSATGVGSYVVTGNTVNYYGGVAQTIGVFNYNNLTISGTRSGSPAITFASGIVGIGGTFSITTTGVSSYVVTGNTINYSATAGGQTINNTFAYNNLTVSNTTGTNTAAGNIVVNGTLTTPTGGTLDLVTFTLSGTLGTVTNNGTIATQSTTAALPTGKAWGGTINYNRPTGGQSIVSATSYNNLTLSNTTSGIQTSAADLVVNGTLTTPSAGTLALGINTLSGILATITNAGTITTANTTATPIPTGRTWGGTVSYNSASAQIIVNGNYTNLNGTGGARTLSSSGTVGISGTFTPGAGAYTVTSSTVNYTTLGGGQTIAALTYNNLTSSNTSGNNSAAGNIVVNGTLTTTSGGTLRMQGNTLSGTLVTIANAGTITTANTSATPFPSGRTWGGTVTYFLTTGLQTVVEATYNNLLLRNTSNSDTLAGNIVVNGTLTTTAGGTFALSTFTLSGTLVTITNNGTITTRNTSATPIPSGKTWGGTINYNAATGTQTIMGGTYTTLTMGNSSGTQTASGNIITTTLNNNTAGIIFNMATFTLAATTINNNATATIRTQNTSLTPIPSGITIAGTVNYDAATGLQRVIGNTYSNLTMSNTSGIQTINGNVTVNGVLTLTSGGTLAIASNTLNINGTISGMSSTATISCNGLSNIVIGGSGALGGSLFLDQTTPATTNRLNNLTYNRSLQTITLGNAMQVKGTVTPTAGTLATGGFLTLISDATGDAGIGAGSGSYITGNVTVERFVPSSARGWRFMSSAVSGSTLDDWKNEIHITGIGGIANGFDATISNQAGVFSYNEAVITGDKNTGWVAATNITNALTAGKGFRVFVRGDRTAGRLDGSISAQNAVTINSINPVNTGDVNMLPTFTSSGTLANDGWNLMGNPYPSAIDWNAFHDAGRTGSAPDFSGTDYAHLDATISILNAGAGNYAQFNAFSGATVGALAGGIIPSGAAFWVKASAASPTMTMKEIYKTATAAGSMFKTEATQFRLKLIANNTSYDEATFKYVTEATPGLDAYDIAKLYGSNVNIASIGSDGSFLSANYKPLVGATDTIGLSVGIATTGTYTLESIDPDFLTDLPVYLVDYYASKYVNVREQPSYLFEVDVNKPETKGNARFALIIGEIEVPTLVKEAEGVSSQLIMYPSVTTENITIQKQYTDNHPAIISITDVSGKAVKIYSELEWQNNQIVLDLSDNVAGAYFVTVTGNGYTKVFKCIKQ